MSRIAGLVMCSAMSLMLGAGITIAATATSLQTELDAGRHSLDDTMKHLAAANEGWGQVGNPQIRKALDYLDLAKAELDEFQMGRKLQ